MELEQEANICTITTETERVVGYRPGFARVFGGANCALLLSQFWFWTQTPTVRERDGDGWFWKTRREIMEETGLTRREQETARRKLRELGILREELRGIPATLHFQLDQDALARCLQQETPPDRPALPPAPFARNRPAGRAQSAQQSGAKPPNKLAQNRPTNTEKTSEITAKTTQTRAKPVLPAAFGGVPHPSPLLRKERESEDTIFHPLLSEGEGRRLAAGVRYSAAGLSGPGEVPEPRLRLPERQCAVNRQGTARFWDALEAARKIAAQTKAAQDSEASARDGPMSATKASR